MINGKKCKLFFTEGNVKKIPLNVDLRDFIFQDFLNIVLIIQILKPFPLAPRTNLFSLQTRNADWHLLHCKWISLLVVQVLFQIKEGVEEYVSHPAALQIT